MITVTTTRIRLAAVTVAWVGTSLLAACTSSTTSGRGQAVAPTNRSASSASGSTAASTPPPSTSPTAPASPVIPAPSVPVATHTVHTVDGRTYLVKIWVRRHDDDCVAHAYGAPMLAFLRAHRCSGLDRVLATTAVDGRPIAYAESSTAFAGTSTQPYGVTAAFRKLIEANGTGSLNDLLREGYRLPSGPTAIPPSEAFDVIGQDNGVAVWDLWYLDGPTPDQDKTLLRVVTDLYLQF